MKQYCTMNKQYSRTYPIIAAQFIYIKEFTTVHRAYANFIDKASLEQLTTAFGGNVSNYSLWFACYLKGGRHHFIIRENHIAIHYQRTCCTGIDIWVGSKSAKGEENGYLR